MSKSPKSSKTKKTTQPVSRLGRGLSALMQDVSMDKVLPGAAQKAPAAKRKSSKVTAIKASDKKASDRKTSDKKPSTKKTKPEKTSAQKPPAKKPASKKTTAKKQSLKKPAAKKASPKTSPKISTKVPAKAKSAAISAAKPKPAAKPKAKIKTNPIAKTPARPAAKQVEKKPVKKTPAPLSVTPSTPSRGVMMVAMDQLTRNPEQPRRYFDKALLDELANSIRDKGVLQPILVREIPRRYKSTTTKAAYQIIAGERRWQAALMAGLTSLPVFIRDITDQEALEIGVVENVQRADLNPMEEALAYRALIDQFKRTQEDISKAIGKSRPYIANMLRLLSLPKSVQIYLAEGKISAGHARAIIAAPDPQQIADLIIEQGLSVRGAENRVRQLKEQENIAAGQGASGGNALGAGSERAGGFKDADTRRLEAQLMDGLGLTVDLQIKPGSEAGEMRIKYKNYDQLDNLISRLLGGGL